MTRLEFNIKAASENYTTGDTQLVEPEDINFTQPLGDNNLRRTNPNRYDKRKDWLNLGKDEDVSERYDQSKLSWRLLDPVHIVDKGDWGAFGDTKVKADNVFEFQAPNGQIRYFKFIKPVKAAQLVQYRIYGSSYKQYNAGADIVQLLGYTDIDVAYGDGGVKFNSWKEVLQKYPAPNIKAFEENIERIATERWGTDSYGHAVYMYVKDEISSDSGPWYYLYNGRWCRGSGAEKLTFWEVEEVTYIPIELSSTLSWKELKPSEICLKLAIDIIPYDMLNIIDGYISDGGGLDLILDYISQQYSSTYEQYEPYIIAYVNSVMGIEKQGSTASKFSWKEQKGEWPEADYGKMLKEEPYSGGAGPEVDKIVQNNNALFTFLDAQGIPYVTRTLRDIYKDIDAFSESEKAAILRKGKYRMIISYDRWGYVVEGNIPTKYEADQVNLNEVAKIIKDFMYSKKTAENEGPAPGFIPTNRGMQTPEDIYEDLQYISYKSNREYDRYKDIGSKENNPDYDFEKSRIKWHNFWTQHGGFSEDKISRFERRYYNETGGK